jgi:hypothetical protein
MPAATARKQTGAGTPRWMAWPIRLGARPRKSWWAVTAVIRSQNGRGRGPGGSQRLVPQTASSSNGRTPSSTRFIYLLRNPMSPLPAYCHRSAFPSSRSAPFSDHLGSQARRRRRPRPR